MPAAKRETSADSAARFFELRSGRSVRLGPSRYMRPPEQWEWIEKNLPGCYLAWVSTVKLPSELFRFGTTGKPVRGVAVDQRCYTNDNTDCQCRVFVDGAWQRKPHKQRRWPERPVDPNPHVEEHW